MVRKVVVRMLVLMLMVVRQDVLGMRVMDMIRDVGVAVIVAMVVSMMRMLKRVCTTTMSR